MIITTISGGLGNQLFQYAAGKALATYHNVPLKLENSYYNRIKHRTFELDKFNIDIAIASEAEIKKLTNQNFLISTAQKLLPAHKKSTFIEPHFNYYNRFFQTPAESYLAGLWQSEKYFSSIKDTIQREFAIKPELIVQLKTKGEDMQKENSISVHIRRGDYLQPKVREIMGLLPEDYFQKALNYAQEKVGFNKIYFFSDDIAFVKQFVKLDTPHEFISGSITTNHLEDFYLMQQCKHNIIANSTFSWWSAWLNKNPDKLVIAPQKWFNDPNKNFSDLIPPQWHKM